MQVNTYTVNGQQNNEITNGCQVTKTGACICRKLNLQNNPMFNEIKPISSCWLGKNSELKNTT